MRWGCMLNVLQHLWGSALWELEGNQNLGPVGVAGSKVQLAGADCLSVHGYMRGTGGGWNKQIKD